LLPGVVACGEVEREPAVARGVAGGVRVRVDKHLHHAACVWSKEMERGGEGMR